MADVTKEADRLRVPSWMLSAICGGMLVVAGTGVKTWATGEQNSDTLAKHETRLGTVEGKIGAIQTDIAVIKQVQSEHDAANSSKLDRILALELRRDHK